METGTATAPPRLVELVLGSLRPRLLVAREEPALPEARPQPSHSRLLVRHPQAPPLQALATTLALALLLRLVP